MKAFNRVNPQGRMYTLVEQIGGNTLIRHRVSERTMIVPHHIMIVMDAWDQWRRGQFVQDAFSFMSVNEREFLMTGLDPEEFEHITYNQMEHE